MACMIHTCLNCQSEYFDNEPVAPTKCRECGGTRFNSHCEDGLDDGMSDRTEDGR